MDYHAVNAITVKDRYSSPHIEDLLNSTHGSCWITKLDLAAGYHQIRIAPADRQMMAFASKIWCLRVASYAVWHGERTQPVHADDERHLRTNETQIHRRIT